jgi:hypothetical protein
MYGRVLLLKVLLLLPILAEGAKTSDLLIISGARAVWKWKAGEEQVGEGTKEGEKAKNYFIAQESIQLVRRRAAPPAKKKTSKAPVAPMTRVSVSVRGIPEARLFLVDKNHPAPDSRAGCAMAKPDIWLRIDMQDDSAAVMYLACFAAERFEKAQGDILITADDAEPEKMSISFERQEGFFASTWMNAMIAPVLAATGGVIAGVFGFLGFLAQQSYTRRTEQKKAFDERKNEAGKALSEFFHGDHALYRYADTSDEDKLKQLRESLTAKGIYAMLPAEQRQKLGGVFDDSKRSAERRLAEFDRVMSVNFGEFIPLRREDK